MIDNDNNEINILELINELTSIADENNLHIVNPDAADDNIDYFHDPIEKRLGKLIGRLIWMLNNI